ncbi:MAG: hypothetical protein ACI4XL_01750 [Bacillus sp. (in: firmicutes)]
MVLYCDGSWMVIESLIGLAIVPFANANCEMTKEPAATVFIAEGVPGGV